MRHLIIGNGVAGVTAAQAIRTADAQAEIHILSAEPYLYYFRPKLWELISGKSAEEAVYFRPQSFYDEKNIQVHLGVRAEKIDPSGHEVRTSTGETLRYDRLLLAMGGRSFVPPIEGSDQKGVFSLRTLADAHALMAAADEVKQGVVIGGGLLGLETAYSLLERGLAVTVIEFMPRLLPRQLDEPGAAVLQSQLEAMGLKILTGGTAETIRRENSQLQVQLKDGRSESGGLVLFSTGIRSNLSPAQEAGIETERSVVIDEYLQTSAEDIFAAGDTAQFNGVNYGIIPAATEQGRAAGSNMVNDRSTLYSGTTPSTRLKVVGITMASLGDATAEDPQAVILRRSGPQKGVYQRLTLRDGKVTGAILLGDASSFLAVKRLIESGQDVTAHAEHLLDEGFDLKSLTQGSQPG